MFLIYSTLHRTNINISRYNLAFSAIFSSQLETFILTKQKSYCNKHHGAHTLNVIFTLGVGAVDNHSPLDEVRSNVQECFLDTKWILQSEQPDVCFFNQQH